MKLRIGRFSYSNLFPIFYMLEHTCDCSGYEFIEGVPSELNRMLRAGEIDISPSSSIEYLRAPDMYDYVMGHSVSSRGPVGSILLFSKKPLEALDGSTIMMTSQSDTSVVMLQIILSKFYGLSCSYRITADPLEKVIRSNDAYLLIGDDALSEALKWPEMHIYDLGMIWTKETGLPFIYALWLIRKENMIRQRDAAEKFIRDLGRAKLAALSDLRQVAKASPLRAGLSEDDLVEYWRNMIDYDLRDDHLRGLSLFRKYSMELGLL
jgi:chorismate dehydratase